MNPAKTFDFAEKWRQLLCLLQRRIWTIITFSAVTLLVVVVGTSLETPVYEATATVLIDMEAPNVVDISTLRDESTVAQSNYLTYADYYRTQLEVIKSRTTAERVFANLKLNEQSQYARATDPVGALLARVNLEPIKQTRLAQINVEDPDPKQAAKLANEFALVFVEENFAKTAANETMNLMKDRYLKLQSKEAELSKRYKDKFPAVVRLRQQMAQLTRAMEQEMKREIQYERHQAEGGGSGKEEADKSFLERLHASSKMGGLRPNNIRVIDFAVPPLTPAKPNAKLNFLLGLFLGFIGGLGAGVVEDFLDNSVKSPEDIERDLGFLLLGHIPHFDGLLAGTKSTLQQRYQYIHEGPHSVAAEAYRALRTNLIYAAPQGDSIAVIVTSPGSEEGKTTTITNMGIALTQIGLKVLIVDADLRKPRINDAFQVAQKPGLSEFLIGQVSFEKVIRATEIPGLWIVPSGAFPPNPAELLGLPQMREFLKQATAKFDRVLVDTPPVIAVTDAVILAAITKTVVVVAQSEKTPRQALYRLNSLMNGVQAKVLGVVLNSVLPRYASTYYGYSSYSSYYMTDGPSSKDDKNNRSTLDRLSSLLKRFKTNKRRAGSGKEDELVRRSIGRNAKV